MPARKSSPSKAKKTPTKTRSRSRSRSRSTARKPSTRSRSRSTARSSKSDVQQKKDAVLTPTRKSPSRTKTPPRTKPDVETPPRVSRRILEKTVHQNVTPLSHAGAAIQATDFVTPAEIYDYFESPVGILSDYASPELMAGSTPFHGNPLRKRLACSSTTIDSNNNAWEKVTKTSVTATGDGAKVKAVTTTTTATTSSSTGGVVNGTGPGYMGGLLVLFVIALTYYLNMACTKKQCALFKLPPCDHKWQTFFNLEVAGITLAFHALIFILALVPVGSIIQGPPMKNGKRLEYRCNGWLTLIVLAALFGYAVQRGCPMDYIDKHYLQFVTASLIFAFLLTLIVLFCGWNSPLGVRCPGSDGTFLNDVWMGRELNPRFGNLDVKQVLVRSGMLAWVVVDGMYLAAQFKADGKFNPALALVVLFHTLYCVFSIKNEDILVVYHLDFVAHGVGFMLSVGLLTFLPYLYTYTTRFIYLHPQHAASDPTHLALVIIMEAIGLAIFIGSNWQKSEFRKNPYNPKVSHLSSIQTTTGKKLLCSGCWGVVRRPNYLGDLLMALSWSLACGYEHTLPYFYPVYLLVLLGTRAINDEKSCHHRYGNDWVMYTNVVPYRIIPYIF